MRSPKTPVIAAALLVVCFTGAQAQAQQRTATSAQAVVPPAPMVLPGVGAGIAAHSADRTTGLIGTQPSPAAARRARAAGADPLGPGAWEVPVGAARALAARLRARGLLDYAEPNRRSHVSQAVAPDPLSTRTNWRDAAIDPTLVPPPVTPDSPLLALVDTRADMTHPEFADNPNARVLTRGPVTDGHGTATMAVAGAPQNGVGMVGAWPGMRTLNVPLPARPSRKIFCSDSVRGIDRSVAAGAAVINMSYGSASYCRAEHEALQRATRRGVVLVAAGGNELTDGNPLEFPASLPHVLTIGASTPRDEPAWFSNSNAAIDLVAPGVGITTAVPTSVPPRHGGHPSGYAEVQGTSFSAPIVAAAATWVRQVRPELSADQVQQVVRLSARDIGAPGYDSATGFGKLDLAAALVKAPPLATPDPQEPNEEIALVDGTRFGTPNPLVFDGRRPARLEATLDFYEDPADVYRIRVPARSTVRVVVRRTSTNGNPDVYLYDRAARSLRDRGRIIARSTRGPGVTDVVRTRNPGARARIVYVRVSPQRPSRANPFLDAKYELRVSRVG